MREFFVSAFTYFSRHKFLLIGTLVALTFYLLYSASHIQVEEDIMSIMPRTEENERISFILQNISSSDKIILQISLSDTTQSPDPEQLIRYADRVADSLNNLIQEQLIRDVFYQTDVSQMLEVMNLIYENLPYFLDEADYTGLDSLLNREKIAEILTDNRKKLTSPIGMIYRDALLKDPLHLSAPILQELQSFQVESNYSIHDGYIFSKNESAVMMFITPVYPSSETGKNKIMVQRLEKILKKISADDTGLNISYFGSVIVAVTNATQIKTDSLISIIIAVILISIILASYFRSLRMIVLLLLPIAFGGLFSLGMLALVKGSISAIALGTGSIVLGIAIDYSLHFFIHLHQESSIEKTIRGVSFPLTVGSITTVSAFLCLIFLKSQLLEDFGLFAAFTLIGTIIFTLIFLPHLLSQKKLHKQKIKGNTIWNRMAGYAIEKNNLVIFIILVLSILFSFYAKNVKFEDNMNKINYMTQEQKEALSELSSSTTLSQKMIYFANEGHSMDDALVEFEQFLPTLQELQYQGSLNSYSSIGRFLPSQKKQKERIEYWNHFWEGKRTEIEQYIIEESISLGFSSTAFQNFITLLNHDFSPQSSSYFDPIKHTLLENFLIEKEGKSIVLSWLYSDPKHSSEIEEQLTISNKSLCFDTTTMTKSMLSELSSEFNYILWICGIIVLIFLFFSFGRIEITLISFLPMVIAFIWILGIMAIFDIRFNIVNIILATFIFGIGDDYSIFIMEGLLHEYTYGKKMLKTYKTAVILSAITMFVGIGSLIFAKHPAMFSLAQVTIIGMISVALISYTVSPYIFRLMTTKKGNKRLIPVTFWNLAKSILSFTVFLIGSIILTLIGFLIITLGGKTERHKYQFHVCLWAIMRGLCKIMIQIPFKIINPSHETFEKPAVIISNHQSHLDLLYILALSPKIIVLTNKWVWNSPFYGWILRYADFIPVADGIEENLPRLEELTKQGYSILIFPEGTRSADSSILRFHKGAFYLAEKLNLDIIPILVHGIGHILPKTEFMLRRGKVTVKIMNRISPDNPEYRNFPELYMEAKAFRELYRVEFKKLVQETETADYFHNLVLHNYFYKGSQMERMTRKILRKNSSFSTIIEQLPDDGSVLIRNCGAGVFTLTAALVKKNLQITAIDPNENHLEIANHCISKPSNLKYFTHIKEENSFDYIYNLEEEKGLFILKKEKI